MFEIDHRLNVQYTGNFHSLFKSNDKKYYCIEKVILNQRLFVQEYTYGGRTSVRTLVVCFSLCDFLNEISK